VASDAQLEYTSMGRKMQLLKQKLVHVKILLQERQGDSQATMKQEWSLSEILNKIDNEMDMQELIAKIAGTTITFGTADKWVWKHNVAAGFSVKSAYKLQPAAKPVSAGALERGTGSHL